MEPTILTEIKRIIVTQGKRFDRGKSDTQQRTCNNRNNIIPCMMHLLKLLHVHVVHVTKRTIPVHIPPKIVLLKPENNHLKIQDHVLGEQFHPFMRLKKVIYESQIFFFNFNIYKKNLQSLYMYMQN